MRRRQATSARSSSSTARPTSSPRATSSRRPLDRPHATSSLDQGDADLGAQSLDGATVDDVVKGLAGTLGEKIELGRVVRFETDRRSARRLQAHPERAGRRRRARRARRRRPGDAKAQRGRARHRAAHRRARRPATSPATTCPADDVDTRAGDPRGADARRGQARAGDGRRSSTGKLNGFFKTVALLEQPFVKDQKTTISALVDGLGGDATVRRFARVKIGEE